MNVGGFPTYASLSWPALRGRPASPTRRIAPRYPSEESEIMLAAFTPDNCKAPKFTPSHTNATLTTEVPCSVVFNTNGDTPQTFTASTLPHGLSINPTNGNITGIPTDIGPLDVTVTATNACGSDNATLHFNVQGFPAPDTTPWPINLARKGTTRFRRSHRSSIDSYSDNSDNISLPTWAVFFPLLQSTRLWAGEIMPRPSSLVPFSPTITPGFHRVHRTTPRKICTRTISSGKNRLSRYLIPQCLPRSKINEPTRCS